MRSIRFAKNASICIFPQLFLQAMLRAEGFAEIGYVEAASAACTLEPLGLGAADFAISFALPEILEIEAGSSITILGGLHAGCYELFARDEITSVSQLKGRRVGLETASPALLSLMAANVRLDPKNGCPRPRSARSQDLSRRAARCQWGRRGCCPHRPGSRVRRHLRPRG